MTLRSSTSLDGSPDRARRSDNAVAQFPLSATCFLLLTLGISLTWSHFKLMWEDEILELWTDSLPNFAQIIHIQRKSTIAIEPIAYHALSHSAELLFGTGAFGIRFPSLLGFLLMQICLYIFIRRIATQGAAVFALAFPALTNTLYYSAEGRPYGLLLGWFGLVMVSWQAATRRESQRTPALTTLAAAVALSLNTHYFGVLLLVPLCGAEMFRIWQRRRLDIPIIASISVGIGGIVFALPFVKAASEFHKNFFDNNGLNFRIITQSYRSMFLNYTQYSPDIQRAVSILLAILALGFLWGCAQQLRNRTLRFPSSEAVFLILLAGLPFFGFLMAHFVTHAIQNRYVLGALMGVTGLLAIVMTPVFRNARASKFTLVLLFAGIVITGAVRIDHQINDSHNFMSSLTISAESKAAVMASPSKSLYFGYLGTFAAASYYEPDPEVRSRMTLVYSIEQEERWCHMDTMARLSLHASLFTGLNILPYESLTTQPGDHIFVLAHSTQEWVDQDLATTQTPLHIIGSAFGGDVVSVRFLH